MRRSGPHPATAKTPRGGHYGNSVVNSDRRTSDIAGQYEDSYYHQENDGEEAHDFLSGCIL